jgi:hypothetical protein
MEKHLEFIQAVINRLAQSSFLVKGWAITLVSAMFALAAKDADPKFITIAYFPAIVFWLLDGYYLYQERLFRKLYDQARKQQVADYSLSTKDFDKGIRDWISAVFSKTIFPFYAVIIGVILIIMFHFKA